MNGSRFGWKHNFLWNVRTSTLWYFSRLNPIYPGFCDLLMKHHPRPHHARAVSTQFLLAYASHCNSFARVLVLRGAPLIRAS